MTTLLRPEIRRRVLSLLGYEPNGAQAFELTEKLNEEIRNACTTVYDECDWERTTRQTIVVLGIDQTVINYPDYAEAKDVHAVSLWIEDSNLFVPLTQTHYRNELTDTPLATAGGDEAEARRTRPRWYALSNQIRIGPRADREYQVAILHSISPEMDDEIKPSVVDGLMIVHEVCRRMYLNQGDKDLAMDSQRQYYKRYDALQLGEHPRTIVKRFPTGALQRQGIQSNYVPSPPPIQYE